jgi:hypothetical protein
MPDFDRRLFLAATAAAVATPNVASGLEATKSFAVPTPPATRAGVGFRSRSGEPSSATPCVAARSRSRSRRCIGIRSGESCARSPRGPGRPACRRDPGSLRRRVCRAGACRGQRTGAALRTRPGGTCGDDPGERDARRAVVARHGKTVHCDRRRGDERGPHADSAL